MPFNGVGVFTLTQPAFVPGTTISSASVNSDLSDIAANGLSKCLTVDSQNPLTSPFKLPSGTAAVPSLTFVAALNTGMYLISATTIGLTCSGTLIGIVDIGHQGSGHDGNLIYYNTPSGFAFPSPVGSVVDFAGATAPSGWLLCFGQTLNISSYPELFFVISNTFGGDGLTTFGIPDCRGRVTGGKDNMGGTPANRVTAGGGNFNATVLGGTGGQQNITISNSNLPVTTLTFTGNSVTPTGSFTGTSGAVTSSDVTVAHWNSVSLVGGGGGPGTAPNSAFVPCNAPTINNFTPVGTISINAITPSGTISSFGGGTSVATVPPMIIFNKIIFAGRP